MILRVIKVIILVTFLRHLKVCFKNALCVTTSNDTVNETVKFPNIIEQKIHEGYKVYNIGVLMASKLDSPFDLERCGPAIDIGLDRINKDYLDHHKVFLHKVQQR
ncbi:hypothetical protein PVAND_014295 [Polypedilum vanderplanki]|uniref:Secreted protein n=1 Tax=Polypedilum vanderplanki TaxID=319348 RepID=A0A9J6CTH4_POLVA|nr:hypothetical protein PVAND_014295 [Polypedilum vanderplanki]